MSKLELQTFGFPHVRLDGQAVDLPLRKALALLLYLADTDAPVGRDVVAGLLWPDADPNSARAGLRRTLHRLHVMLGREIVAADRNSLRMSSELRIEVDAHAFAIACDRGEFDSAMQLYGGDFLDGFSIRGAPTFDEWTYFRREALRSRLAQVLERSFDAKMQAKDFHSAIICGTRLLALDPISENAHRNLIRAHMQAGNRPAAERQLEACARLLRDELGIEPEQETRALLSEEAEVQALEPQTRYATNSGVHLAYQVVGNGGADIVFVPGFVSHVERCWEEPRCRAFLLRCASLGRLIIFDRRGVGLSDRVGDAPTVEATAADIRTVLDAVGSRKAVLIGASEGGPSCVRFAAHSPQRLAGLVLYGSLAKGSSSADYPHALSRKQFDLWLKRLVDQWGGPAEIETFAPSLASDRHIRAWWAGLLRTASSPGAISAVLEALRDTDIRALLPRITTPTLVLHRAGDRAVRVEAGRHLARNIVGARFVELEGSDHWFWAGEQDMAFAAIKDFIALCARAKPHDRRAQVSGSGDGEFGA
jgi:DNA-binding SARP family transcriptional activator/pimeloyl-ACP methyl ester carboxylesterase